MPVYGIEAQQISKGAKRLERVPTGIQGLDSLLMGGVTAGRSLSICGIAGSGKTVLLAQFAYMACVREEIPVAFVAFEETPEDLRSNLRSFGWSIEELEERGLWHFVDCTDLPENVDTYLDGDFRLDGLRERLRHVIEQKGVKRVAIDSVSALFVRFPNPGIVRRELYRITSLLKELQVTSMISVELHPTGGRLTRHGVEEYVTDGVVILRNRLDDVGQRRRTIEIFKLRGSGHANGEYSFSIAADGVTSISLDSFQLKQPSTRTRIKSGCEKLDEMVGGGLFRDSVTVVAGATGTGKTLTAMQFLKGGYENNQKALYLGYEESKAQIVRNAASWGIDIEKMEEDGLLSMYCQFPESASLAQHLNGIMFLLKTYQPNRVVIDSLSAFTRIGSKHAYREFIIGVTSIIKQYQVAGLYTITSDSLYGSDEVTTQNVSTLTDSIVLLRYIENQGKIGRAIGILKMRGSDHSHSFRHLNISDQGMQIGDELESIDGILT